ncbi:MAG: haloacid dehalogenase [Desulfococcaceae bacterium]|nr:haloacid dehalogenase [Desulfococcaceae bacterium]
MDPGLLAFDIDGVVADTMRLFLEIAREDHGIRGIRYEDITGYILEDCLNLDTELINDVIAKLLDGSRDGGLRPISGAREVLMRLGENCGRLCFVTARPSPESIRRWMLNLLSPEPRAAIDLVATGSFEAKADVLKEKGISFFVEDRLETCFLLKEEGIIPILFRQPWNREPHPFQEVGNWEELETLIAF